LSRVGLAPPGGTLPCALLPRVVTAVQDEAETGFVLVHTDPERLAEVDVVGGGGAVGLTGLQTSVAPRESRFFQMPPQTPQEILEDGLRGPDAVMEVEEDEGFFADGSFDIVKETVGQSASPLLFLGLDDREIRPGMVLGGGLTIESVDVDVGVRTRGLNPPEVDGLMTLSWRLNSSFVARESGEFDWEQQVLKLNLLIAAVPAGPVTISVRLETIMDLFANGAATAGVEMGNDLRGEFQIVIHAADDGSFVRALSEVTQNDVTPPRFTDDTFGEVNWGAQATVALAVATDFDLAVLRAFATGRVGGTASIDPNRQPLITYGHAVEGVTGLEANLFGFTVASIDSDFAPRTVEGGLDLPRIAFPIAAEEARGVDAGWALLWDGFGVGREFGFAVSPQATLLHRRGSGVTFHLVKTNRAGQLQWARSVGAFAGAVATLPDGGALQHGSSVMRLSSDGEVLWAQQRPDFTTLFSLQADAFAHENGDLDVWSSHRLRSPDRQVVVRHNPDTGAPLFIKELRADGGLVVQAAHADADGYIVCGSTQQDLVAQPRVVDSAVVRFDRGRQRGLGDAADRRPRRLRRARRRQRARLWRRAAQLLRALPADLPRRALPSWRDALAKAKARVKARVKVKVKVKA
jgi:hypothetical protein